MTNAELRKKFICSRHFLKSSFYVSGQLRKDAVPKMFFNDTDSDISMGIEASSSSEERNNLEERLMEMEKQLKQEKNKSDILRLQVRAKCRVIKCLKAKLSSGSIDDTCLKKAIAKKASGFILTFICLLLFKSKKQIYTSREQQMCMTRHYTSPALYNKMREVFGFHLPSPATIIRWFRKIDIWPGICQPLFTALKIKAAYMEAADPNCVLLFDEMAIKKV